MSRGGITITTVYDSCRPRRVVAIRYRCAACGKVWDHPNLAAGLRAKTSSPFDRECEKHWKVCREPQSVQPEAPGS
jgi:hypothetical protein